MSFEQKTVNKVSDREDHGLTYLTEPLIKMNNQTVKSPTDMAQILSTINYDKKKSSIFESESEVKSYKQVSSVYTYKLQEDQKFCKHDQNQMQAINPTTILNKGSGYQQDQDSQQEYGESSNDESRSLDLEKVVFASKAQEDTILNQGTMTSPNNQISEEDELHMLSSRLIHSPQMTNLIAQDDSPPFQYRIQQPIFAKEPDTSEIESTHPKQNGELELHLQKNEQNKSLNNLSFGSAHLSTFPVPKKDNSQSIETNSQIDLLDSANRRSREGGVLAKIFEAEQEAYFKLSVPCDPQFIPTKKSSSNNEEYQIDNEMRSPNSRKPHPQLVNQTHFTSTDSSRFIELLIDSNSTPQNQEKAALLSSGLQSKQSTNINQSLSPSQFGERVAIQISQTPQEEDQVFDRTMVDFPKVDQVDLTKLDEVDIKSNGVHQYYVSMVDLQVEANESQVQQVAQMAGKRVFSRLAKVQEQWSQAFQIQDHQNLKKTRNSGMTRQMFEEAQPDTEYTVLNTQSEQLNNQLHPQEQSTLQKIDQPYQEDRSQYIHQQVAFSNLYCKQCCVDSYNHYDLLYSEIQNQLCKTQTLQTYSNHQQTSSTISTNESCQQNNNKHKIIINTLDESDTDELRTPSKMALLSQYSPSILSHYSTNKTPASKTPVNTFNSIFSQEVNLQASKHQDPNRMNLPSSVHIMK